jgi:hypothetical protein
VGSHWFQQLLHRDAYGRYIRLPLAYHLVEKRWIHLNGAFVLPDDVRGYFAFGNVWNEQCVACHNTRPVKNPLPLESWDKARAYTAPSSMPINEVYPRYYTKVAELGIACEACHGAGERHVRAHQNPTRRLVQHYSGEADPTIINPARLSAPRADEVCAHCHAGRMVPRMQEWDLETLADPFLPGRDLQRFYHLFWSEAEQRRQARDVGFVSSAPQRREPLDGRFWGDGTPLTTALEYQGMALSACYQNGQGNMSCLTCHSMHRGDPNHQVKDGMRTNAACTSCHPAYRQKLVEHTHHTADSPGSLCANCHMPYQEYSLLTTHRTHRISIPRVKDSLGTGKPHACNLCHLDKSLGWTQEKLGKWYGTRPEPLSPDDRQWASSLLHLTQSDARSRAVVAGAFVWPAALQASGRDWPGPLLVRALEQERYQAIRYTLHRALRSLYGNAADDYHYQGSPAERAAQVGGLRRRLQSTSGPERTRYPYLPLTVAGDFDDKVLQHLLRTRNDPDLSIHE